MKRTNLIIGFILIALSLASFVSAAETDFTGCPMGEMMYGNYGSGFMLLGWITYILVIALIIAAIYWLIKSANRR